MAAWLVRPPGECCHHAGVLPYHDAAASNLDDPIDDGHRTALRRERVKEQQAYRRGDVDELLDLVDQLTLASKNSVNKISQAANNLTLGSSAS